MRYAVPVSGGIVSPHFGHCEQFALIDVDEEKKEIRKLISHIRFLSAENSVVSLSRDDKKEAMMIDKLYKNWVKELKPKIKSLVMKVRDNWKENI